MLIWLDMDAGLQVVWPFQAGKSGKQWCWHGATVRMNWIDCHNHLQFVGLEDAGHLLEAMRGAGVGRCVVNATRASDWEAVASLAEAYPMMVVPAFGIHPWYAHEAGGTQGARAPQMPAEAGAPCGRLQGLLERFPQMPAEAGAPWGLLRDLLENNPLATVGECGLDGGVATPGPEVQMPVFIGQLRIARAMERVATIHCVRSWGRLFEALAVAAPPPRFLLHAYCGSLETARRLLPMGAYFAFSGRFLQARRAALLDVFRQLPRERIVLETDAPEGLPPPEYVTHPQAGNLNHPANLAAVGGGLAGALGMSAGELADLTSNNARVCFGW